MGLNLITFHMGRYKTAIFIGRDAPDTGLDEYRRLAQRLNIKLDVHTNTPNASRFLPKYDLAFVSRYLAILEALAAGIPVVAHYNNEIKKDYLQMAPFAKYILMFNNPDKVKIKFTKKQVAEGQKWARQQTWEKLADTYIKLWQK